MIPILALGHTDNKEAANTQCCITTNRIDIEKLWLEGQCYGSSTRSTRFKPSFLTQQSAVQSKKKRKKAKAAHTNEDQDELSAPPETLQLNLMEVKYLKELKMIDQVKSVTDGSIIRTIDELIHQSDDVEHSNIEFSQKYTGYKRFRDAKWIPKNGSQYGCDLVLYEKDIDKCHSKYCVTFEEPHQTIGVLEILRTLRVAEQTRKRTLICDENGECVQLKRWILKHEQASNGK
jgi:tRNA-intron lyase